MEKTSSDITEPTDKISPAEYLVIISLALGAVSAAAATGIAIGYFKPYLGNYPSRTTDSADPCAPGQLLTVTADRIQLYTDADPSPDGVNIVASFEAHKDRLFRNTGGCVTDEGATYVLVNGFDDNGNLARLPLIVKTNDVVIDR